MTDETQDRPTPDLEALQAAFQAFNETTRQLQESYEKLQERVTALDLELEKKNAELERNLIEKEAVRSYLNNILHSLTTGVIVVDAERRITTFNKTAERITGQIESNCISKPLDGVFPTDLATSLLDRLQESDTSALIHKEELIRIGDKNLKLRVSASPATDPEGQRIGTVVLVEDITDITRLEEEAQRNDRLRAMGEMAAGIAHEIRNPLASIELFASLLKKDFEGDEEKEATANRIINGVRNMDRTISSLLLFAKSPEPSKQKCDVNSLLQKIINDVTHLQVPENVTLTCNLDADDIIANGDSDLLQQVFLNFMRNAVQAMPDGGTLTIATEKVEAPESETYHRHYIAITLSDTGIGINAHDRQQIFNPFFSTKDKGTGLGLAISHNIVKAHQGTIDVDSREGDGTTFIVKIPGWDES